MNHPLPPFIAPPTAGGSPLAGLRWEHGFGSLDARFYTRLAPTPLPEPYLVAFSPDAAARVLSHRVLEPCRSWERPSDHVPLICEVAI